MFTYYSNFFCSPGLLNNICRFFLFSRTPVDPSSLLHCPGNADTIVYKIDNYPVSDFPFYLLVMLILTNINNNALIYHPTFL